MKRLMSGDKGLRGGKKGRKGKDREKEIHMG